MIIIKRVKFENIQFSNPDWCRELHQFEQSVAHFTRDMRLKVNYG